MIAATFRIELYDDVKTVYDKVAQASAKIIRKNILNWTNGMLKGIKQDKVNTANYKRRRPEDGLFSFSDNVKNIYNSIRGQTNPYPGAFFKAKVNGKITIVYVWSATIPKEIGFASKEEIKLIKESGCAEVLCGDGNKITLVRLQAKCDVEMWAYDFFTQNDVEIL